MLKHTLSGGHHHHHAHLCATAAKSNITTNNGPRKPRSQSQSSAETSSTNAIHQHHHQADAADRATGAAAAAHNHNVTSNVAESRRWYHNQSDGEDTAQSASTAAPSRSRRRNRSKGGGASDVSDTPAAGRGKGSKSPASASVGGGCGADADGAAEDAAAASSKMSRRRPPSGAESAVRRWNSFHSTRGECHPNKFRRDRKATSPSIEVGVHHRRLLLSGAMAAAEAAAANGGAHQQQATPMGLTQKAKLMRGRSLATSETVLLTMTPPGGGILHGMQHRRYSQQQRAASVCLGNRYGTTQSNNVGGRPKTPAGENHLQSSLESATTCKSDAITTISRQSSVDGQPPSTDESDTTTTSGAHHPSAVDVSPVVAIDKKGAAAAATAATTKGNNRGSHSSDTSSAYSATSADTLTSSPSVHTNHELADEVLVATSDVIGDQVVSFIDSDDDDDDDETDIVGDDGGGRGDEEAAHDADDDDDGETEYDDDEEDEEEDLEDLVESIDSLAIRDTVRECLDKEPADRTEADIEALLDFTKHLAAFANQTQSLRRALCAVLRYAVVEHPGTVVMTDGEQLDAWCVLINGHVETELPADTLTAAGSAGAKQQLHVGDGFGIDRTMAKQYHRGVMRTASADCQFLCVPHLEYYRIWHQGAENTQTHTDETGRAVMVTELRSFGGEEGWGPVVIRGTPDHLTKLLIADTNDTHYAEDFLLTHRTFVYSPSRIADQLFAWFQEPATFECTAGASQTLDACEVRDRIVDTVLLWVNNHFTVDFEPQARMIDFLDRLLTAMERLGASMAQPLHELLTACTARAQTRSVTLARSARDEPLQFEVIGGSGGAGIFIESVDDGSKAAEKGLKRGDQIVDVNGHSFVSGIGLTVAEEQLRATTHLSVTVRWNVQGFRALLHQPTAAGGLLQYMAVDLPPGGRPLHGRRQTMSNIARLEEVAATTTQATLPAAATTTTDRAQQQRSSVLSTLNCGSGSSSSVKSKAKYFTQTRTASHIQRALDRINMLPRNAMNLLMEGLNPALCASDDHINLKATASKIAAANQKVAGQLNNNQPPAIHVVASDINSGGGGASHHTITLQHSQSNPDLTMLLTTTTDDDRIADMRHASSAAASAAAAVVDQPEHVLKIYRADQTSKYLLVFRETTAHEVVMLALQEFGCHESSALYSLCEVSVGAGGMIKQRRLPEQLQNLAERIGLAARYYLKTNSVLAEKLVPDEMAPDIVREATVHLLQLNANQLAVQLTLQDYGIFRSIDATEYIAELYAGDGEESSPEGAKLAKFAQLVNRQMFWVITAVCSETNMMRRMRTIKQFVKIARHCKECRNFNAMFAIVSGLGHASVTRLRLTWEKLPFKYQRVLGDLQELMDPTRNMNKYRQMLAGAMQDDSGGGGVEAAAAVIPFYPVVKKDLTFIHLGNDSLGADGLVNFEKLRMLGKEVRALRRMCAAVPSQVLALRAEGAKTTTMASTATGAMAALNQMANNGLAMGGGGEERIAAAFGGGTRRRKKSSVVLNPKRMFEEAQMVRRIRAYLDGMRVSTDEEELSRMSAECEPLSVSGSMGGGSLGSVSGSSLTLGGAAGCLTLGGGVGRQQQSHQTTVSTCGGGGGARRGAPSPTLSAHSSTSSASESAQRLMAVSAAMVSVCGPKSSGGGGGSAVAQMTGAKVRRLTNPDEKYVANLGAEATDVYPDEMGHDSVFHTPDAAGPPAQHRTGSCCEVRTGLSYFTTHGRSNSDTPAACETRTRRQMPPH